MDIGVGLRPGCETTMTSLRDSYYWAALAAWPTGRPLPPEAEALRHGNPHDTDFASCQTEIDTYAVMMRLWRLPRSCGHVRYAPGCSGPTGCLPCAAREVGIWWASADRRWQLRQDVERSTSHSTSGVTCGNARVGSTRVGVVKRSTVTLHPAPYAAVTLAEIRQLVEFEGGTVTAAPADWAVAFDLPSPLSFSRWLLNAYTSAEFARAGLRWRRKTVHGRRLIEITAAPTNQEKVSE